MATFNGTNVVTVGNATKKSHYDQVFDNILAIKQGDQALDRLSVGEAAGVNAFVTVGGTFAGSTNVRGVHVKPTLTTPVNGEASGILVSAGTIVEAGSGTHPLLATLDVRPFVVTGGGGSVTNTATVYVNGAMSATVTGRNYALWVDDGRVRIDDAIALGGGVAPTLGTIGGSGPSVAAQNEWLRIETQNGIRFIPVWA